jgi:hypothetical protein
MHQSERSESFDRRPQSAMGIRKSAIRRPSFTLVEVLTTVAALVIVLGLMVRLARDVRHQSAERLTRELLVQLDELMTRYYTTNDRRLPVVPSLIDRPGIVDEPALMQNALHNNHQWVAALRLHGGLTPAVLGELPIAIYDGTTLRDAWGTPIVFVPAWDPAMDLGMAPDDRFFFLSAGPDRRFLTREDNLYSYEGVVE